MLCFSFFYFFFFCSFFSFEKPWHSSERPGQFYSTAANVQRRRFSVAKCGKVKYWMRTSFNCYRDSAWTAGTGSINLTQLRCINFSWQNYLTVLLSPLCPLPALRPSNENIFFPPFLFFSSIFRHSTYLHLYLCFSSNFLTDSLPTALSFRHVEHDRHLTQSANTLQKFIDVNVYMSNEKKESPTCLNRACAWR